MGDIADIEAILEWVRATHAVPLAGDLVPGTTVEQRTHLAVTGGLVASLVPRRQLGAWPEALQTWVANAPTPPRPVAKSLTRAIRRNVDLFANLYCALVAGQQRRRLGTFFTPRPLVEFILDNVIGAKANATLVDPGAGVGAFALAAAARWPSLSVVAVDINIVTLGMLGAAVYQAGHTNVILEHSDYISWLSDHQRGENETMLLVGNPPYTRHQELDRKSKESMVAASRGLVSSRLAGLSAYFLAASLNSMRNGDELCFVLPAPWTEARYGRELRAWLWQQTERPISVHMFPADSEIFPGTQVSAMVLQIGARCTTGAALALHRAELKDKVTTSAVRTVPRTGDPPRSLGPMLWHQISHHSNGRVPLGELTTVRRGVATGANSFFFLSDDQIERLPSGAVVAAVRRLRHVEGEVLDTAAHRRIGIRGKPRWLLMLDDSSVTDTPGVQSLLALGRQEGIPHRYLASVRTPWYAVERIEPAHLLVAIMSKDRFRVVRNVVRAIHSNSMYGVYLQKPSLAKPLAQWLASDVGQAAMWDEARHYSDGLRKLEPKDLARVLVPTEPELRTTASVHEAHAGGRATWG